MEEKKTMLGLPENIECALCYALFWVSGIVFLVLERENKLVKYHAIQSIITFLGLSIASFIIGLMPVLGVLAQILLAIGIFILWLYLLVRTYEGVKVTVLFAGEMAEKIAN